MLIVCRRDGAADAPPGSSLQEWVKPGAAPEVVAVQETPGETGVECIVMRRLGSRLHPTTNVMCEYMFGVVTGSTPPPSPSRPHAPARHDEQGDRELPHGHPGDHEMATTGDFTWPLLGDFFMATDTRMRRIRDGFADWLRDPHLFSARLPTPCQVSRA